MTLTITDCSPDEYCNICNKPLKLGIVTAECGVIGADCFVASIAKDKKRFTRGKPGADWIRELAKIAHNGTAARRGLGPEHFRFNT